MFVDSRPEYSFPPQRGGTYTAVEIQPAPGLEINHRRCIYRHSAPMRASIRVRVWQSLVPDNVGRF